MKVENYRRPSAHLDGKIDDLWRAWEALADEVAELRKKLAGGVKATPGAHAAAAEHDVDLSELTGTGKSGYITKGDVEEAAGVVGSIDAQGDEA